MNYSLSAIFFESPLTSNFLLQILGVSPLFDLLFVACMEGFLSTTLEYTVRKMEVISGCYARVNNPYERGALKVVAAGQVRVSKSTVRDPNTKNYQYQAEYNFSNSSV